MSGQVVPRPSSQPANSQLQERTHNARNNFILYNFILCVYALQAEKSRVQFPMVLLEIFFDIILPAAPMTRGLLSLQQKRIPGIFNGG